MQRGVYTESRRRTPDISESPEYSGGRQSVQLQSVRCYRDKSEGCQARCHRVARNIPGYAHLTFAIALAKRIYSYTSTSVNLIFSFQLRQVRRDQEI